MLIVTWALCQLCYGLLRAHARTRCVVLELHIAAFRHIVSGDKSGINPSTLPRSAEDPHKVQVSVEACDHEPDQVTCKLSADLLQSRKRSGSYHRAVRNH